MNGLEQQILFKIIIIQRFFMLLHGKGIELLQVIWEEDRGLQYISPLI